MDICKNIDEKIIFFDDLTPAEQEAVRAHVNECAGCREKLQAYENLRASLQHHQAAHQVDDELLARYSVSLAAPDSPEIPGKALSLIEWNAVKKHLESCAHCRARVAALVREYREMADFLEDSVIADLSIAGVPGSASEGSREDLAGGAPRSGIMAFFSAAPFRQFATLLAAFLILVSLVWVSPLFRGGDSLYYQLGSLEGESFSPATRSTQANLLNEGLQAFQNGSYLPTTDLLEAYIATAPTAAGLFEAHYYAGLSQLLSAGNHLAGRFHSYDSAQLQSAIKHLSAAEGLTGNLGWKEDCFWYLGKCYLLQLDKRQAKEMFEKVQQLQGKRTAAAQQMLLEIDNLPQL